jgi:hypothetical protein
MRVKRLDELFYVQTMSRRQSLFGPTCIDSDDVHAEISNGVS